MMMISDLPSEFPPVIGEHLSEAGVADDGVDDERVFSGIWDIIRVVVPIKDDGVVRLV